jgi:RNA polymerase sigma-70 factor, ECF subfamily
MNTAAPRTHLSDGANPCRPVEHLASRAHVPAADEQTRPSFDLVYDAWFNTTLRWLRAFGIPSSDVEDVAQEVFLVVQRKLPAFDHRNLPGWLYGITYRTASDYRRRSWFRNLFSRAVEMPRDRSDPDSPTPPEQLEKKQSQRILFHLIGKMKHKRRTTFVLAELEGYSADEIAALEQIPAATVRTRLHYARKDFYELVRDFQRQEVGR